MRLQRIINSLLETDMYKFSMGQAIFHQFPSYMTMWDFKCRNKGVRFTHEMVEEIRRQIKSYCELSFNEDELAYLKNIEWIKRDYVDYLRLWHPRFEEFSIRETDEGCGLEIETFGTWANTSFYEIPTLAIVNEVYFRMAHDYDGLLKSFKERADKKVQAVAEHERLGLWIDAKRLVVLDQALAPSVGVARVVANAAKERGVGFSKVAQKDVGAHGVGKGDSVKNAVFLDPSLKHKPV